MDKRNTIQKELVRKAVVELHHHVSAEEVYDYIKKDYPGISKGTVYRNLTLLVEENKLRKVALPDGPDRFDFTLKPHYHIQCIKCNEIFDVDMEEITNLEEKIHDKQGFDFLSHDILFKGVCPKCLKKEKKE